MSGGQNLMDDAAQAKCGAVGHLANHLLFTIYQSADEPAANACFVGNDLEKWSLFSISNSNFRAGLQLMTKASHHLNIANKCDICQPNLKVSWINQTNVINRFLFEPNLGSLYWYPVLRLQRHAYLSQSNGNLVRNINCTKLLGSELITSQNLLLSFETARFQHVAVSNLLFFDSLPHCKLIFLMEAHMNIKHETMKRDLQT